MNKPHKRIKRYQLALLFAVVIFLILLLTMFLVGLGAFVLNRAGIIDIRPIRAPFFLFAIVSVIVGTMLALIFSRVPLAPMREIIDATDRLAKGDFTVRINLKGPEEIHMLNTSFNHMAKELGSIEMLRSDFVNNFSHEFKTPIVSVRGFAKLLKHEDLSQEERDEYLDIIIGESDRLAELATNMLNLSKVENQAIVADKTRYNGSEQIRRVIALLEARWTQKDIEIRFDCAEVDFYGNEELLGQVWTNLIDNAIKFSPEHSVVTIGIRPRPDSVAVSVTDQGIGMGAETAERLFDKFYQGDTSHATKGNGIGLTLAKRIIELHGGEISAQSSGRETEFVVELPTE